MVGVDKIFHLNISTRFINPKCFMLTIAEGTSEYTKSSIQKRRDENSEIISTEKKEIERERRLIPYMTYYVAQSLLNTDSQRPHTFIPISSPQKSNQNSQVIPLISPSPLNGENAQLLDGISRPAIILQNPVYLTAVPNSAGERNHQQFLKGVGSSGEILRQSPGNHQQILTTHFLQRPVQTENQPREIKIDPRRQKLVAPTVIKIIPVIARLTPTGFGSPLPPFPHAASETLHRGPSADQSLRSHPTTPVFENQKLGIKYYSGHTSLRSESPSDGADEPKEVSTASNSKFLLTSVEASEGLSRPRQDSEVFNLTTPGFLSRPVQVNGSVAKVSVRPLVYYVQSAKDLPKKEVYSTGPREYFYDRNPKPLPRLRVPQEEDIKFVAGVTPISINNDLANVARVPKIDGDALGRLHVYKQPPLDNFLSAIKETDNLPQNFTPNNIDEGIKTLAFILERLQQNNAAKKKISDPGSSTKTGGAAAEQTYRSTKKVHSFPQPSGTSTPGRPGVDYPTFSSIPPTKFNCSTQRYKGFFGDPDTKCQVWHYCDLNGGQASFLCPNGTIFSQVALTCDWWFNVKCATTSQLYVLNERLYKYILPFSPSFPEDFSGPVVDTYLAAKFKEMEAKSKSKALKSPTTTDKPNKAEAKTSTDAPIAAKAAEESLTPADLFQ